MSKDAIKIIATNPNARKNFHIEEVVEAGISITGTEVKSLREQTPNLRDAFVEISSKNGGQELRAFLLNAFIPPYSHGTQWNHEPDRRRDLLLHRHQIHKLFAASQQKGYSIVPIKIYFKKGWVKVELGLGRGKKFHDKRDALKERSAEREIQSATKRRGRDGY